MRFFDYIHFALKNIWRQKLRSALTIFAIVIGAMSVISMISLVLGASNVFLQQIESAGALTQVTVSANKDATNQDILNGGGGNNAGDSAKLTDDTVASIKQIPNVLDATAVTYVYPLQIAQLKDDPTGKKYSLNTQAYTPGAAGDKQMQEGRNLTAGDSKGVVTLDFDIATKMGFKDNPKDLIGRTLIFTTQAGYSGEGAVITKPPQNGGNNNDAFNQDQKQVTHIEAQIVGIAAAGPFGNGAAYITLDWAKHLLENQRWGLTDQEQKDYDAANKAFQEQQKQQQNQTPHSNLQQIPPSMPPLHLIIDNTQLTQQGYQSIVVRVAKADDADGVATAVKKMGLGAATAKEFMDTILKTFKILGLVFGAIGAISLGVAAIGVVNTMVMATLERTREIGVMRACGATKGAVRWLFTFEASMLGFWGGVTGVVLGIALSKVANIVANRLLANQHITATNIISLPPWFMLAVIAATTIIGLLAGLYPAARAAKLNPVDALRYE